MASINYNGSTYFLDDYQYIVSCKLAGQGKLGIKDGKIVFYQYIFLLADLHGSDKNINLNKIESVDNKDDIIKTINSYLKMNSTKKATFDGCCIKLPDGNSCSIPQTLDDELW